MPQLFTVQRLLTVAVGLLAIGTWRFWRRPAASRISEEVEALRRLAKDRRP